VQPKTVHKFFFLTLALAFIACGNGMGQITSATADHVDSLVYPMNPGKDPLYVFYQPQGSTKEGTLTATYPGGGSADFEWVAYDPALPGFGPPVSSEAGVEVSTLTGLADGGYRVTITNGPGTDTTFLAWVMLNKLQVRLGDENDPVIPDDGIYFDCDRVALFGFVETDTLHYFDPLSHMDLSRALDFSFRWTSDNPNLDIPADTITLSPNISYSPPYEDTWYFLTATDETGMSRRDSLFYESIQTKADFYIEYWDKVALAFDSSLTSDWKEDGGSTDAELTVRFTNTSLNGARFDWVLLDTTGGVPYEVTTFDTTEMPEFTYSRADKYYYPYMYSYSEEGCVDSVRYNQGIYVEPSQLEIPNVFSPNDDGQNDIWKFKHQSLKTCRITVVDRTGKVVYKQKIDDIYTWDGWDGNVRDSDRRAPEGQYYFVIEAEGYDGQTFKDPSLWSQMKIFGGPGTNNSGNNQGGNTGNTGNGEDPSSQTLYTGWLYIFRN